MNVNKSINFRASPNTIEHQIYHNKIKKNLNKFAEPLLSNLVDNFMKSEQGVIQTNGIRLTQMLPQLGIEGCKLQVGRILFR